MACENSSHKPQKLQPGNHQSLFFSVADRLRSSVLHWHGLGRTLGDKLLAIEPSPAVAHQNGPSVCSESVRSHVHNIQPLIPTPQDCTCQSTSAEDACAFVVNCDSRTPNSPNTTGLSRCPAKPKFSAYCAIVSSPAMGYAERLTKSALELAIAG